MPVRKTVSPAGAEADEHWTALVDVAARRTRRLRVYTARAEQVRQPKSDSASEQPQRGLEAVHKQHAANAQRRLLHAVGVPGPAAWARACVCVGACVSALCNEPSRPRRRWYGCMPHMPQATAHMPAP